MANADLTPEQPKRAVKILRLAHYHSRPKLLFDLPREIRDVIWAYALHEPTLYNKRHKPGCVFHNHSAAYQVPPALIHYDDRSTPRMPFGIGKADIQRCRETCIRRQGFGLLKGVSKQVQREASETFWENEMPCFADSLRAPRPPTLMSSLRSIPKPTLERVQRLSLWQIEDFSGMGSYEYSRANLLEFLYTMPNLTHLEVPSALLEALDEEKFFSLPKLQTVRVYALRHVFVENGNDYVPLYIAAGGEWKMPPCCFDSKPIEGGLRPKPVSQWCVACQDTREEMLQLSRDLQKYRTRRREWTALACRKLAQLEPAQPGETPYIVHCRLDEKRAKHEMRVWGLPIHPPEVRAAEARRAAKMENLANIVRRPPTLPVFSDPDAGYDDEADFSVTGQKALGRRHRAVEKRVDHEKLLEERGNHQKNVARAEAVRAKEECVVSGKAMKDARDELKVEKKAAAKRAARRTS